MVGAALGTLFGLVFGLPGVIIGPFVGAVLGELTTNRDLARAGRAGVAAWIGFCARDYREGGAGLRDARDLPGRFPPLTPLLPSATLTVNRVREQEGDTTAYERRTDAPSPRIHRR